MPGGADARMHVLGAGSVGCLWSARLALAGAAPTLLLRPGSAKAAACARGVAELRLESPPRVCEAGAVGRDQVRRVSVGVDVADARSAGAGHRDIKTLLVATKAYAAVPALESVSARLAPDAVVLLLCNGALALSESIRSSAALAHAHVVLGSTTHGTWTREDFHVVHAGVGQTYFGRPPESRLGDAGYRAALAQVSAADLGASDVGDGILGNLWLKLAANASINPLTALWEVPNGSVLESAEGRRLVRKVCQEIADVAEAVAAASAGGDEGAPSPPSAEALREFVEQVVAMTARNRSSMLQDIAGGRATEVDFLSGWVEAKGRQLGVPVPVNEELATGVRRKEAGRADRPRC